MRTLSEAARVLAEYIGEQDREVFGGGLGSSGGLMTYALIFSSPPH